MRITLIIDDKEIKRVDTGEFGLTCTHCGKDNCRVTAYRIDKPDALDTNESLQSYKIALQISCGECDAEIWLDGSEEKTK